jgi:CDP-diacylglycerol--glycerol-3-phosphate 3-phosphatidyltransferase
MPSIYQLKPAFQGVLRPAMRALAAAGVTPNAVTLSAVIGSAVVGGLVAVRSPDARWLLLLPVWLFVRMALNAIDGMMARELHQSSRLGLVLNEIGDVVADTVLFLPLALAGPDARWAIVWFTIGAILSEFAGVLGVVVGGARQYQGPVGKSDRAFLVGLLALATALWPAAQVWWATVFWAATAGVALTCVNRLRAALRQD